MSISKQSDQRRYSIPLIALLIMLTSGVASLWLAFGAHVGVVAACVGLGVDILLGTLFWRGHSWARKWILARYFLGLTYAVSLGLLTVNQVGGLFGVAASLCMLILLWGRASRRRAFSVVTVYFVVVCVLAGTVLALVQQRREVEKVILAAGSPRGVDSHLQYHLSLDSLPWRVLTHTQAERLLGMDIQDADIKLVRDDGSSFGLIFPLQFQNTKLSPVLSSKLESEIREVWLSDLNNWRRTDQSDGFLLTADGHVGQISVAYAIFYKHFGNLGLYGVFWAEKQNEERLVAEALVFYDALQADPLRERLTKFTASQIYDQNSDAVVRINVYDEKQELVGRGSGFNLASAGLIVTDLHVVATGQTVEVVFPNHGTFNDVYVVALTRPETDLVLLSLKSSDLPTIKALKSVPVVSGDAIYVIGETDSRVLSSGIVGGVQQLGDLTLYQITAPIAEESSGGPVFSEFGEVIGVTNSVAVSAQKLSFGVSIDELERLFVLDKPITVPELVERLEAARAPEQSSESSFYE